MPRDVSKYHVQGVPVPSVTECLDQAGFIDLTRIPFQVLEDARIRGTAVHTWLEMLVDTPDAIRGLDPPDVIAGYIAAWERWRTESGFEIECVEGIVVDPLYRYAGCFDCVGSMKRVRGMVDYKARYGLTPEVGPQTAGYLGGLRAEARLGDERIQADEPVDRFALLLRPNATYRFELQDGIDDLDAFRSAVRSTHWKLHHNITTLERIRGIQ
jgi:hypothetical protein